MITIIIHYSKNTFIDDKRARRERETHIAEAPRRNTRTIIHKHIHTYTDQYLRTWRGWGWGVTLPPSSLLWEWADRVSKGRGFWTNVKDATAFHRETISLAGPSPRFLRQTHASRESQCFLLREFRKKTETRSIQKQSNIAFLFEIEMENVDFVDWQWWWW